MPKASQRLLDDSAFDVEGWLAGKIATRFIRAEAAAFVNGDGVDKPKGFLLPAKVANASWTWGNLGYVAVGCGGGLSDDQRGRLHRQPGLCAGGGLPGECDLRDELEDRGRGAQDEGRGRALPVVGRAGGGRAGAADGLSGADRRGHAGHRGERLCHRLWRLRAGYTIAERPDLRVLRDPFSAKPHVLFYATKRVGGDVTDFAAIKLLKFAVS